MCVCVFVVILRLSYFLFFSFVFNYYLQCTIKFNLTFRLKGIRSMYSGTVSLEYHADACNYPFSLPFLSFLAFFFFLLFVFRPDRDPGRRLVIY